MTQKRIRQWQNEAADVWLAGSGRVSPERIAADLQMLALGTASIGLLRGQIRKIRKDLFRTMKPLQSFVEQAQSLRDGAEYRFEDDSAVHEERDLVATWRAQQGYEEYVRQIEWELGRTIGNLEKLLISDVYKAFRTFEDAKRILFDPFIFPTSEKLN